MLIYRILASLVRCAIRIEACVYQVSMDVASTCYCYIQDKRLGDIDTSRSIRDSLIQRRSLKDPSAQGIYGDAFKYEPTGYRTLNKIIKYLNLNKDDVFVDYGCGKGRVVFVAATQQLKKVIGVELDKNLADIAKLYIGKLKQNNTPIEILNMDALNFDPGEGTVFFLYNPFGYRSVNAILNKIKDSLITQPRGIRIVYANPAWRIVLDAQDWLEEEKNENMPFYVWHNRVSGAIRCNSN